MVAGMQVGTPSAGQELAAYQQQASPLGPAPPQVLDPKTCTATSCNERVQFESAES